MRSIRVPRLGRAELTLANLRVLRDLHRREHDAQSRRDSDAAAWRFRAEHAEHALELLRAEHRGLREHAHQLETNARHARRRDEERLLQVAELKAANATLIRRIAGLEAQRDTADPDRAKVMEP